MTVSSARRLSCRAVRFHLHCHGKPRHSWHEKHSRSSRSFRRGSLRRGTGRPSSRDPHCRADRRNRDRCRFGPSIAARARGRRVSSPNLLQCSPGRDRRARPSRPARRQGPIRQFRPSGIRTPPQRCRARSSRALRSRSFGCHPRVRQPIRSRPPETGPRRRLWRRSHRSTRLPHAALRSGWRAMRSAGRNPFRRSPGLILQSHRTGPACGSPPRHACAPASGCRRRQTVKRRSPAPRAGRQPGSPLHARQGPHRSAR